MKKLYFLDTWVLFLIFLAPYITQNIADGQIPTLLFYVFSGAWFYKLTLDLHKRLPNGHELNLQKFSFHFFFAAVYILVVLIFIGGYHITTRNIDEYGSSGPILFILHLFTMYCMFYCIYFSAKTLASVYYTEPNPQFSTYVGSFLSFWFLPFGIWFLQPKIKKIFGQKPATNSALPASPDRTSRDAPPV